MTIDSSHGGSNPNLLLRTSTDIYVNLKLWLGELRQSKGVTFIVENSVCMLVNRGRLLKSIAMIIGFICVGLIVFYGMIQHDEFVENAITDSQMDDHFRDVTMVKMKKLESPLLQEPQQKQRRKAVMTVCKRSLKNPYKENVFSNLGHIDPKAFRNIYVVDKYKVLYCAVPKVACTNFQRIMLILTGQMNTTDPIRLSPALVHGDYQNTYLRKLNTYTAKEIVKKIQGYFKFMFVREPFERILSAYRNKFINTYTDNFKLKFGRKIIKRYRKNPSNTSLERGQDVQFHEFVKYLVDPLTSEEEELNAHWKQYYKLCHPCQVKYDFIGKYDSLEEDVDKLLHILNVSDIIDFPRAKSGVPTSELTQKYFSNVTLQEVHKLWKLYSVDYSMFGYKYPNFH